MECQHTTGAEQLHIGTCAWSFEDWRGVFYPPHLPANQRLEFYARYLNAVEIDSTFYARPARQTVTHWHAVTPAGFTFSAKLPREITHERKLRQCGDLLGDFLEAIQPLEEKLGCILVQLPPYFTLQNDEHALRDFVAHLPGGFRFAIEFRDPGWHLPRIAHWLEEHRVCWVWNDLTPLHHSLEGPFESMPLTTDFLYVRLMGDLKTKFAADGSRIHRYQQLLWPRDAALESWTLRVGQFLDKVARVFLFTNNHFEGFAPHTSQRIAERLGAGFPLPSAAELSGKTDAAQLELL